MLSLGGGRAAQVAVAVAAVVAAVVAGVGAVCPGTGPAGRDEPEPEPGEDEPGPEPEPEPRPGPDRDWGSVRAAAAGLGDAPSKFSLGQVGFDVMPVLRLCGASAAALARLATGPVPVLGLAVPVAVVLASLAPPLNSVLNIANRIGYGVPRKCPRPSQMVTMCRERRNRAVPLGKSKTSNKRERESTVSWRRPTKDGEKGMGSDPKVGLPRQRADEYRKQPARVDESTRRVVGEHTIQPSGRLAATTPESSACSAES